MSQLLSDNPADLQVPIENRFRQVLVRAITSPAKPQAQPGLVPWANLTTPDVWYRGQTLYAYHPQSQDCIQVDGGTKLNIYAFYVKWLLVGLEEEPGERAGLASVGFVDSNCIKGIDDGRQVSFFLA